MSVTLPRPSIQLHPFAEVASPSAAVGELHSFAKPQSFVPSTKQITTAFDNKAVTVHDTNPWYGCMLRRPITAVALVCRMFAIRFRDAMTRCDGAMTRWNDDRVIAPSPSISIFSTQQIWSFSVIIVSVHMTILTNTEITGQCNHAL